MRLVIGWILSLGSVVDVAATSGGVNAASIGVDPASAIAAASVGVSSFISSDGTFAVLQLEMVVRRLELAV